MTKIKKVRIGSQRYDIFYIKNYENGNRPLAGRIVSEQSEIFIDSSMDEFNQRQTLFHEIIHGLLDHGGIRKHDEKTIDILAYGLMQLIEDNLKLFEKINGAKK